MNSSKIFQWIGDLTEIREKLFNLLMELKFEKHTDAGEKEVRTTLNPTAAEQLKIDKLSDQYNTLVSEIFRFLDKYPLQKDRFSYLENEAGSYLRFERVGRDLDEDTWKKIFIREFKQISESMTVFLKELAESIDKSVQYKCFRTAQDCNLAINYDKHQVFVIMPFVDTLYEIYKIGVKEVLEPRGYICQRADEITHHRDIMCHGICKPIQEAAVVIADLTQKNPNVFFELGLAYGFEKEVLLIANSIDDIPFDLRSMNSIIYNGSISLLREKLVNSFPKL